jgi:hypothetical protein
MLKYLVFLSLFLIVISCKKKDTTWNTDWAAPLIADTLKLTNLYNDSTLTTSNQTTIDVDLTRTILDIGLSDLLTIPDTLITQIYSPTLSINNVPPGSNFVNSIEEHILDLNDIQLKKIRVSEGKIKVKVFNPLTTKVYYTVQLPGVTKNGSLFEQTYFVDAGSIAQPASSQEDLDLAGYDIDLTGESGLNYNRLQSKISIKTDENGPVVSITSQHDFKFDGEISGIKIDYAKGYFGSQLISDTSNVVISQLNSIIGGTLDIPSPNLTFTIENGMKVSLKGKLTLAENTNSSNNTVSLSSSNIGSDFYIAQAIGNWDNLQPASYQIEFNSGNSNIEQYLENLGSEHKLGYQLQLNPWGNVSGGADEVFPTSRIKAKVNFQMPLQIGSDGLTLRDTFNFDLSQDPSKIHANSGIVTLNATNAFPLSCEPVLYFMDENNFILHTVLGTTQIASSNLGTLNPLSGLKEKKSQVEFLLPSELVSDLNRIRFVAVEARFDTPNPTTGSNESQTIPYGAFLAVKLNVKLNGTIIY